MKVSPQVKIQKALDKIAELLDVVSAAVEKTAEPSVAPVAKRKYKKSKKAKSKKAK